MRVGGCLVTILALVVAHPSRSQESEPVAVGTGDGSVAVSATIMFSRAQPSRDNIVLSRGSALFKVEVGGREVWGLLDNRSERSIIDMALAQSVGLEVQPADGTFLGPFGREDKRRVSNVPIMIPDQLEMQAPALAAVDLQRLSVLHEREIGFVLGQDYLAPLFLFLDTGRRMFKLMPSGESRTTGGPDPVALATQSHMVEVDIGGGKHPAVLDLALGVPMRMSPAEFSRLQPNALPSGRAERTRRLDGGVSIGGMTATNPPVLIAAAEEGGAEIAIGLPMFRNSTVLVDFGQQKLWLLPSAPPNAAADRQEGPSPAQG